jgi:hypothetical protein
VNQGTVFAAPVVAPVTTVADRPYSLARTFGTPTEELLTRACARLAAVHEPAYPHWWSVRRTELPDSVLGPARTIWLGCASFATAAAVFAVRDSYDAASRALLGELFIAEGE